MPPSALEWGLKEEAKRRAPKSKPGTRASRGERVLGALFPNRSYGWPGGWSQNRLEQVFHFKNWTYNCVDTIASKIGELIPNLAYVRDHQVPGKTFKSWDARAAFGGTSSFYHAGNYFHPHHKKALSVVKPHEELEPLPANHRLRRLIENPNPVDTSFDLLYELSMFLDLTGIGYIWMVPNDYGIVSELWIIPSHWVWPRTGGGAYVAPDNPYSERLVQYYEVRPWGGVSGAGALRFPPNEVIMVKWKSPINKIDGYAKLSAISTWIDSEESIGNSRWSQFMNQGLPGIAVECAASVDDPDDNRIRRMEAKFMEKLQGEFNTGKPWFIPSGTKVTPLSFNPQQMMYLETEEQIRDNILATFRVPKAVLGLSQDMTYGSILAGLAGFCSFSINPRLIMLGLQLSKFLAPIFAREGESIRIWWDDSSPADPAQVNSDIEVDYRCQAISPNEIRSLRGRHGWAHGGKDPMGSGPIGVQPIPMETGEDLQEFADLIAPMATVGQQPGGGPGGQEGMPGAPPQEPEGAEGTSEGAVPQEEAVKPPEPDKDVNVLSGIQEPNGPPQKAKKYKPCPRCGNKSIKGNEHVLWCNNLNCSWSKKIRKIGGTNRLKSLMKATTNGVHKRKLRNQL